MTVFQRLLANFFFDFSGLLKLFAKVFKTYKLFYYGRIIFWINFKKVSLGLKEHLENCGLK